MTPGVAEFIIEFAVSAGEAVGFACKNSAAAPVTNGDDIEVPEYVMLAVSLEKLAEVICEPGANMSTHEP